jgi:hypothetical protein
LISERGLQKSKGLSSPGTSEFQGELYKVMSHELSVMSFSSKLLTHNS